MTLKPVYWLTCVFLILAASLSATTIVLPTDEQLIAKAPVIARGTVLSSEALEENGAIYTDTKLHVESTIKGEAPAVITIREIGGIVGDRISRIYGTPDFKAGERVLVFLSPHGAHYRTVDLFAGKFGEERTRTGGRLWLRSEEIPNVQLLDGELEPTVSSGLDRDGDRFEAYVNDRAAGREGMRDYFVPKSATPRTRVEANFTLIDEPTVYRWFAFDSGQTAHWWSYGTQSGYTGGGLSELRTAMDSWTSYGAANIRYAYDGTFSSNPAGLTRTNGRNEVLFNDPLNEIDGTFNASTGGVVGVGGFNGISSAQSWTAPFTDGSHGGSYRAWNITEGNLIIQDGVSPSARLSSSRLAEIISHEFGHTLGFGHSADGTALMYANVTGLGPSLRGDDQTAARWLYPAAGGGTPAPAPTPGPTAPSAPTGLSASASGSTVYLQWNDNAVNETVQSVYASSGGAYAKQADLAANVREVSLSGYPAGTYSFYVVASNAAGTSAPSNVATVTIAAPQPALVASFTWAPSTVYVDDYVAFTDTSSGGVTSRLWNFGDGTSSSQATPVKKYTTGGTFTVTLTVYRGSESRVVSQTISVGQRTPVQPPVEPYRSVISVTAQTNGVGGSVWRTELTLFNAGSEGTNVDLMFVPGAGGTVLKRSIFLSPRQTQSYANTLRDLYGLSAGSGAIALEATSAASTPLLKVTSRTFNDTSYGTYGLAVPDIGTDAMQQTLYITGIAANANFRTNLGLVNRSAAPVAASLTLYEPGGGTVATSNVTIPASNFQQAPLGTFFPSIGGRTFDTLSMRVTTSARDAVSAYASVVDNRTQDPVYMQALPAPTGGDLTVPVVGRVPGANSTFWRSDVMLFNPTSSWLSLTLTYGGARKSLFLQGGETAAIADILSQFGVTSGTGALRVTWGSGTGPIVTSRTYTTVDGGGTYGQSIEGVTAFGREAYVTGLRSDWSFRTNIGFVNAGDDMMSVEATLLSAGGSPVATATVQLMPRAQVQYGISALFPGVDASSLGNFTLQARSSSNALFAYGSVVDNASGDPVFFAGR